MRTTETTEAKETLMFENARLAEHADEMCNAFGTGWTRCFTNGLASNAAVVDGEVGELVRFGLNACNQSRFCDWTAVD